MSAPEVLETIPDSPSAFADAEWEDIAPYYDALLTLELQESAIPEWLAAWSRLDALVGEAANRAYMRYTADTSDSEAEERYLRFSTRITPESDRAQVLLSRRLVATGYSEPGLEEVLRGFRTDIEIFRDENVPLMADLEEMSAAYQKITGTMTVEWDGRRRTLPQLLPFLQSEDRTVRERAFRTGTAPYMAARDQLAGLFDRMLSHRQRIARNAGFDNYEQYAFRAKHRFDYTPDDCRRFHDAIEQAVVPAVKRLHEERRGKLKLTKLRPWDLAVDPTGAPPLRPFSGAAEFVAGGERIFHAVHPQFGEQFALMAREGLLDLESREGKAPGGYCLTLHHTGLPYVHMNAVGIHDDVSTLVHEAGHCFHTFARRGLRYLWQRHTGSEASELASMSMELLAAPHLEKPTGYYSADDARRARIEHLEDIIAGLPHIASVDAFQHWIYTSSDGADALARDRRWLELRSRFETGVDWSGLERERVARWYRQLHVFEYPFYYVEYGIAQLGALQIWRNARRDKSAAVEAYRSALALGGTRALPEIFATAGAALVFDTRTLKDLIAMTEEELERLKQAAAKAR